MQNKKRVIITITAGLLICSFSSAKAEHTRHNNGTFAGTFLSTRMDVNDDGAVANWATGVVTGDLKYTIQSVSEGVPTGPTAECPGGVSIIDAASGIGFGTATGTFPNGDQLYLQVLTRSQCGLGGGRFTASDTLAIVGGTGKFAGASGTIERSYSTFFQAFDQNAVPPQGFGSFSGEFNGTLILP